jgi:cyanate permease
MRRIWATVVGVWAMLAIVAMLAWTRQQAPAPLPQATPTVLVVKGKNGTQHLVVVNTVGGSHATTQTSPPPPA